MKNKTQLHCGACGDEFDKIFDLNLHITNCRAAGLKLLCARMAYNDFIGHPFSNFLYVVHRTIPLINSYTLAISNELDNLTRSKLHVKLCDALGFEYTKFHPFESEDILEVPNFQQARDILYDAIGKYFLDNVLSGKY